MCGRFTHLYTWRELRELYGLASMPADELKPSYNASPTHLVPILRVIRAPEAERELRTMRWGLVPFWAKGEPPKYSTINAVAETIAEKPAYRGPWKRGQRCVIPASGFYEWQVQPSGPKIPYYIRPAGDKEIFSFGGLWESSITADGREVLSCTIITVPVNELLAKIHNVRQRMPLILHQDDIDTWLSGSVEDATKLMVPYPSELMRAHKVDTRVNSPKNNGPELIQPVDLDD